MKVNTGPELKFDEMTDIEKKLFLHSYFSIKSHMISENFAQIRSSREKDEECYRWRYADNEKLFYETDLIKHKLDSLQSDAQKNIPDAKMAEVMALFAGEYQKHIEDVDRINAERKSFLNFGIDLSDLNIDFDTAKKLYLQMPELYRNMIESCHNGNGLLYGIYTQEQMLAGGVPLQFGE